MLNNSFDLLEELIIDGNAGRVLDNRPEDFHLRPAREGPASGAANCDEAETAYKQSRVNSLLWAYRDIGYLYSDLNPLGEAYSEQFTSLGQVKAASYHALGLEEFGLGQEDLGSSFFAGRGIGKSLPLSQILEAFKRTYLGYIGVEFLHIQNKDKREWLIDRMEGSLNQSPLEPGQKRTILEDLIEAEELERYLHGTFVGQRRFSLEGSEAVIPALHYLLDGSASRGIERIVLGATHRGRLTILALIVGKPLEELFYLFEQGFKPGILGGSDDVKYHIGYSSVHRHPDGSGVAITLSPNASHLESVTPIVEGRARGFQDLIGEEGKLKVIPVILHGDAALPGQGVVAEVLNMSQLEGYSTGGTIHVIVNNQIGFTTPSRNAHSGLNPTDIAKSNGVPIFHVNGDKPEAVVHVMRMAMDFRQAFGADVIVDIFGYRRHGHNEGDEPAFTHPFMYNLIQNHPSVAALYGEECARSGVLTGEEVEAMRRDFKASLAAALVREREALPRFEKEAEGSSEPHPEPQAPSTAVDEALLARIAQGLTALPAGMRIHDKLKSIVTGKLKTFKEKRLLDWAFAEASAFGSLLLEGTHVRLSGEDVARGTFVQRHLVWWEVGARTGSFYTPLDNLAPGQRRMALFDSPLSEFGVLGFEYGYASEYKDALVMWEAQFGDFCNGAQVIIDNYLIAAESKWGNANGLVLLLPHGFEGAGPEHSSAHFERFLALCAEENIRVANLSTPAQYFHLLRAQAKDPIKKPLVIMTPKSLLRHPDALSPIEDFTTRGFMPVLDDAGATGSEKGLIFCTGKVYYDLAQKLKASGRRDKAIVRIERLYPFPAPELGAIMARYPGAASALWVQEEPRNRGAWGFMRDHFETTFPSLKLGYIGRKASASPATGSHERHASEQAELVSAAFETPTGGQL